MEGEGPGKGQSAVPEKAPPAAKSPNRRNLLRWGVVGLAVVVGLIAWLATRDSGGGSSEPAPSEAGAPRIVTVADLREAAATLGQPIYWAGPLPGKEMELMELAGGTGGVQVAYLPEGAEAGEGSAKKALTIGSYPLPDPNAALDGFAKQPEAVVFKGSGGRKVVVSKKVPTSAYFVSPDNSVQVEVYDPSSKRAIDLALSGKVQPAG
jgi:hypothetical protein